MIRTCIFDLGNVLILFSHAKMYEQLGAIFGEKPEALRRAMVAEGRLDALETGRLSADELHDALCDTFVRVGSPRPSREQFALAASDIFVPNPGMDALVGALKAIDVGLVLLSNTSALHFEFIEQHFDTVAPFHHRTLSYEIGAMKPDPAIYADAVTKAGCPASECLFIDDMAVNVAGAQKTGLKAVQFVGAAQLRTDLTAHGLTRLG